MINKKQESLEEIRINIEQKLRLLPELPGCYLMKDANDQLLYVGKAKNLRNRVRSYFRGAHDTKTTKLVSEIHHFETIVTNSNKEALLLEIHGDASPQEGLFSPGPGAARAERALRPSGRDAPGRAHARRGRRGRGRRDARRRGGQPLALRRLGLEGAYGLIPLPNHSHIPA